MIEVRHASIEFGASVAPDEAEEIVRQALRLAARMLPGTDGLIRSVTLPDVEIAGGADVRAAAEALAGALVRGIADAQKEPHA